MTRDEQITTASAETTDASPEAIVGADRRPKRYDWPAGARLVVTSREVVLET